MSSVIKLDITRLKTWLISSRLQTDNNALYQVINELILALSAINNAAATSSTSISGGSGGSTVQNFMIFEESISDDGSVSPPSSMSSSSGTDAFIPYFIGPTETFTVPIYKQGLFGMNIDNEGILVVDGFLIEV